MRHNSILNKTTAVLLIIDIQERINAVMKFRDRVAKMQTKLINGFKNIDMFQFSLLNNIARTGTDRKDNFGCFEPTHNC